MNGNAVEQNEIAPLVVATNVEKKLKSRTILRGVSLALSPGEFVGLVGPNGAGKTTLLRHLCGLWVPTSGSVTLFGTPSLEVGDHHLAELGYVNQTFDLPRFTRVAHLLALLRAFHPNWSLEREEYLKDIFSIDATRWINSLSEGEKQRVAILAALAPCPRVLILDEPASALDPASRTNLFAYLRRVVSEENVSVLVSSHILGDLERSADRIVFMREGRIPLDTSMDDLRDARRRIVVRGSAALVSAVAALPNVQVESHGGGTIRVIVKREDVGRLQEIVDGDSGMIEENYLGLDEIYPVLVAEGV